MKQKTKPPLYRLTLSHKVLCAILASDMLKVPNRPFTARWAVQRPDGKWDMGISFHMLDQLQTAAFPKENLSDTVLRIMKGPAQ